jgi:Ca2+-binding RTX toxin-like protein
VNQNSPSVSRPVTVNAGDGDDRITVNNQSISTFPSVTVDGGLGANIVIYNGATYPSGTTPPVLNLTATTLQVGSYGSMSYTSAWAFGVNTSTAHFGALNDTVFVQGTAATTIVTEIATYDGNDTVTVGSGTLGLSAIKGPLQVQGGAGTDTVNLLEGRLVTSGQSYTIGSGEVDRSGAAPVTYFNVEALSISGTPGDDTYTLTGSVPQTSISAGYGTDTLYGPNTPTTWNFQSLNTGYAGSVTFSGVENFIGGTANDTYRFFNGQGISGYIADQGGSNTLDYSLYTTGVVVDLPLSYATGVPNGVYGIQNATGGSGNDILVGDDNSNVLNGGNGRDLLIAGGSNYTYQPDTLLGGGGDDLLIGGFTLYDLDLASLQAVLNAWAQPTDYATRVSNLYSGVGAPALNEGTVFYNYSYANTLTGGAGLDWFFGDPNYDANDADGVNEWFLQVY